MTSKYSGNLINSNVREFEHVNTDDAFVEYEDDINNTIPFMSTLEGVTVRPYFSMVDMNSENKVYCEYNPFDLCLINRLLI